MKLSREIVKALCGGAFPPGTGFCWESVHEFELDHGVIQPIDSSGNYLPGPSLSVVILEDELHFIRAGGDCICGKCGKSYFDHPLYEKAIDWQGEPWLNQLCNGLLVKL